jgi:ketosteroid isomerase-like protein
MTSVIVKVVPAGADLALVYNDWTMTGRAADGRSIERTGKAMEVTRRQADGTWRFILDDPYARGGA